MAETDPLKIVALASEAIAKIKPSDPNWYSQMEKVITRAHTAAWLAGTSERLKVPIDSELLRQGRLSRAEKAEIRKLVDRQLRYLRSFDDARELLSEAQIAARAAMYAEAARQSYLRTRWGDWDIDPDLWPGNQTCRGNCRCTVSIKDNGDGTGILTRKLGGDEGSSCEECPALAGQYPIERMVR